MNVRPRPSQSRALIPLSYRSERLAEAAGLEPAHAKRGDLANRCHTVRRRLHRLAEGTGLEPASDKCAVVFGTTALPVRLPFQRRISDCEFRISDLETVGSDEAKSAFHNSQSQILLGACGRTRTYEVRSGRLISKEGAFAAQPHMRAWNSDFKSHVEDFKSEIHLCYKIDEGRE